MIDEKVHLKCGYIYVKKEKTGTLIFGKLVRILSIQMSTLVATDIFVNTGWTVKSFMFVGKEPVKND